MPGKLLIGVKWNHDPLPSIGQPILAYLLVDITQERAPAETVALAAPLSAYSAMNLSLVLDTSGSMAGPKLQNLKKAVGWVIDHLSPHDTLAITLFDEEVRPLAASAPVADRKSLHDKVAAVREAGGTAMSKGLEVGLEEALKGRRPGAVSRIVLLTDGQTWGDTDRCKELAAMSGASGIPITAMGLGADEDWSVELLDSIASQSGGLSDYIAKPKEIPEAFSRTLRTMQAAVARNLRITFDPTRGVSARAVYRVAPVISKLWPPAEPAEESGPNDGLSPAPTAGNGAGAAASSRVTLPLGDLSMGGAQTLLVEVVFPPRKPGQYRMARLLLEYETADGPSDIPIDLVVKFAVGAGRGPGDPRVMNNVERATTFKLQTRALQAGMLGDVAGATRNLRAAATRLLSMGETELAQATEREAQLLETAGHMSPAGTKKLAFDTRKLPVQEMDNKQGPD